MRHPTWLAAGGAAGITLVGGALLSRWLDLDVVDDAYISLRYADHWAHGSGLVFNPGERVEGYTNFLLVALEAATIRLGATPEAAMGFWGWLSLAGLAGVVAGFAVRQLFAGAALGCALLGAGVALHPVLLAWGLSGLETALYAWLVLAATLLTVGAEAPRRAAAAGALFVLAAMTRPEAAVLAAVAGAIGLRGRRREVWLAFGTVFAIGFSAYFATRALHFGQLFPNTFYAKLDYGSGALLGRGVRYAASFVLASAPLLASAVVAGLRGSRRPPWFDGVGAVTAVMLAIVIYEGGDHFPLFRFGAPILPLLCLLALAAFARAVAGSKPRWIAAALGLLVFSGVWASLARPLGGGEGELARFAREGLLARRWSELGEHLARVAAPGTSVASIAVGALGYHSGLRIVDPHGIVDPEIAHLERELGTGYAGHEKFDVANLLARRPHVLLVFNLAAPQPIPEEVLPRLVWGAFNRELIGHPELAQRYRYESLRVGDAWWSLHVRRDLPPLAGLAGEDARAGSAR